MAMDLMRGADAEDQIAVSPALRLSFSPASSSGRGQAVATDCSRAAAGSGTRTGRAAVVSVLNRMGHARFRRGPTASSPSVPQPSSLTLDPMKLPQPLEKAEQEEEAGASTEEAEGSVSSGTRGPLPGASSSLLLAPAPSLGKPPRPSFSSQPYHPKKRKCEHSSDAGALCHCSGKRASKSTKTVRVPATGSKAADVPADEFSWRKYGQKPIKGSPYPRSYYRCSTVKGCPARKHVERAPDDPATLLVTYEGDHVHPALAAATPPQAGDCNGST